MSTTSTTPSTQKSPKATAKINFEVHVEIEAVASDHFNRIDLLQFKNDVHNTVAALVLAFKYRRGEEAARETRTKMSTVTR